MCELILTLLYSILYLAQVSTVAGNGTAMDMDGVGVMATFNAPYGITIQNSIIYVTDVFGGSVRRIGV